MESFWHRLTELSEVYTRHAARHSPNRLLPAHGRLPEHAGLSPQGSAPDGRTAEPSTPTTCTRTRLNMEEEHATAHDTRYEAGNNGPGAVDRDRNDRARERG
jgi:hypothetical protein